MVPCAFVCQGFAGPGRVGEKPWAGNKQKLAWPENKSAGYFVPLFQRAWSSSRRVEGSLYAYRTDI